MTLYERVGGMTFFDELVERFYAGVEQDPLLRPMYPDDLTGPRRHLALFLAQYWGGPTTYSDERGHPMLRARHMPFTIGEAERDAWMRHMAAAVEESGVDEDVAAELIGYFDRAATHMINTQPMRFVPPG